MLVDFGLVYFGFVWLFGCVGCRLRFLLIVVCFVFVVVCGVGIGWCLLCWCCLRVFVWFD